MQVLDTSIKNRVAIVGDPGHLHYGEIAKVVAYNWDDGLVFVEFRDGAGWDFDDGLEENGTFQGVVILGADDICVKLLTDQLPSMKDELLRLKRMPLSKSINADGDTWWHKQFRYLIAEAMNPTEEAAE